MDDLLSEKEQIEQMRAWWSEYGRYVIAGAIIAVGLLVGFNQYQSSKLETQLEASELYENLAVHVAGGDIDDAEAVADDLANNYANTTYAAQSKLAMARLYMDRNRDQDAVEVLNELLALRGHDELKHIGRLRLGRILLYQDKAQEVVDLLAANEIGSFAALTDELIGDAQTALGNVEAAGEAYRKALADPSPEPTLNRGLVQMKLADLPDPAAVAEATMLEAAEAPESEVSAEDPADEAMSMEVDAELSTDEEAEETQ